MAAEILAELGYTNIKEYGGILDWPMRWNEIKRTRELDTLTPRYKTGDMDGLIRRYVKAQAEVSALRLYILSHYL